ncbi:ABC transporter permease [Calothrix sp. CCY 0018]|uniref:ABC transporter permease n=1 Tax=Calothrix sp. CCY 0018 TaxID=3103864 RepID=UPI0039C704BF
MLVRSSANTWLRGFYPIFRKELVRFFGNKRWISPLFLWMGLSAAPTISLITVGGSSFSANQGIALLSLFLWLGTFPMSIGTIVISQGAIVEEKLTQTLLWICSKPLSGSAFVLAKFAAYAVFIAVIVLGAPALVIGITAAMLGITLNFLFNYLGSILMIYLLLLFILALTLMLGTFFQKISFVTAIALIVYVTGGSLNANKYLKQIEPYSFAALQRYAVETAAGSFPIQALFAIGITLLLIAIFLYIASWQMERYEF